MSLNPGCLSLPYRLTKRGWKVRWEEKKNFFSCSVKQILIRFVAYFHSGLPVVPDSEIPSDVSKTSSQQKILFSYFFRKEMLSRWIENLEFGLNLSDKTKCFQDCQPWNVPNQFPQFYFFEFWFSNFSICISITEK